MATRIRFELTISAVTGRHVRPLHHRAARKLRILVYPFKGDLSRIFMIFLKEGGISSRWSVVGGRGTFDCGGMLPDTAGDIVVSGQDIAEIHFTIYQKECTAE